MGYTLRHRTDISQCVTVILTNLIKAGKDYQYSVTLFVTVSFFCYFCLSARFVDHIMFLRFSQHRALGCSFLGSVFS